MIQLNLVYVHIGKNIPDYIYHSLYQTLLINGHECKIYIILNDDRIEELWDTIDNFNFDLYFKSKFHYKSIINTVPLSLLHNRLNGDEIYKQFCEKMENNFAGIENFREGFWINTTSRFFYIKELMNLYNIKNVFHIENDIIMYESFNSIHSTINNLLKNKLNDIVDNKEDIKEKSNLDEELSKIIDKELYLGGNNKVWVVRDSPRRVVPSLLFFPSVDAINELVDEMVINIIESDKFINDMDNIGKYNNTIDLPIFPLNNYNMIYDGAAIGQYLGGVDIRNVQCNENEREILEYRGVQKGFVNETSVFKPDKYIFTKANIKTNEHNFPLKKFLCIDPETKIISNIANMHIHSKQLYKFSSVFDIGYDDIISGDRVLSLCDFVLLTPEIYNFHRGIQNYANDIIILKDWNNIDVEKLNSIFKELLEIKKTGVIKLFIYTHILEKFCDNVLDKLDKNIEYIIYTHNSDHSFDNTYKKLLEKEYIRHVYAQNIDYTYNTNKLTLLPIGMANSMWIHGDIREIYKVMINSYSNKKNKSLYVNINPNTYGYRKNILDTIKKTKCWVLSGSKPYNEYLKELSEHRFCLCIRGNGLDTHRFWESLYLGVIPVILNNNYTKCSTFIKYLKRLNVPFIVIEDDDIEKMCERYTEEYFDENRYNNIIKKYEQSIFNIHSLKMEFYANIE